MRFSTAIIASALATFAAAQNAFTMSNIPPTIPAGTIYNITWTPTTQGTISLILVQAKSAGSQIVSPVSTIAANITNSGSYAWTVPSSVPKGAGYALEIVSDSNPNVVNYSQQFGIDSSTIAVTTTVASGSTTVTATGTSSTGTDNSTASGSTTSGSSSSGTATGSSTGSSKSMTTTASTTGSATAAATTAAATTSKNAAETARAGVGMLAFVGAAMLVL